MEFWGLARIAIEVFFFLCGFAGNCFFAAKTLSPQRNRREKQKGSRYSFQCSRFNLTLMGNYVRAFCLLGVFALAILPAAGQSIGGVTLFNGQNGTGTGQEIPVGTFRVDGNQLAAAAKQSTFSVRVAKGFQVRFCPDVTITSACEAYGEGTHNLRSLSFTVITVSREARPAPVVVYEAPNWSGRSQVYLPGMYRSDRNEFGNIGDNLARSAIVGKGFRVRFCVDEGISARGAGDCEEHEEGRHNLRFANSISFIEVIDLSDKSPADDKQPVVLYEDRGQVGKRQGYDVGVFVASLGQLGKIRNDTASSIQVKDGYRALVCPDEFSGDSRPPKCEEFRSGRHNLRENDAASYLKVWKEQ